MSTNDEALLIAIINQFKDNKVDYKILAHDLGVPTVGAAIKRWSRYRKRLMDKKISNTSKPAGVHKNSTSSRGMNNKKQFKHGGSDGSSLGEEEIQIVPVRRMPGRKARVLKFKEDTTEDEENNEKQHQQEETYEAKIEDIDNEQGMDTETSWI